jgi:hypothetical protein
MTRSVQSPVERWPGAIVVSDPLTLPQVAALERSIANIGALVDPTQAEIELALLPGILSCVQSHTLQGLPNTLTADNFPGTPRPDAIALLDAISKTVLAIYKNEQTPVPLGD